MKLRITSFRMTTILAAAALVVVMNAFTFAASGTWASTGAMISARDGHTATLLATMNGFERYTKKTRREAFSGRDGAGYPVARAVRTD